MENKELYKTEVNKKIVDLTENGEGITIKTDLGNIEITTYHSQDCCESVYGDFSSFKYHKEDLIGEMLREIVVKSVQGMGFLLIFELAYNEDKKIFVPCYNSQNGYYSSNLELTIKKGDIETKIDISDLVDDHIE